MHFNKVIRVLSSIITQLKKENRISFVTSPTLEEKRLAKELRSVIVNLVNEQFTQTTTLDFETTYDCFLEDINESQETVDVTSEEWQPSQGNVNITENLLQMQKIVRFYDSKKSKKLDQTRKRFGLWVSGKTISRYRRYINSGDTFKNLVKKVNEAVLKRFTEARWKGLPVHDRDLRRWAVVEAELANLKRFKASQDWCDSFKAKNRVSSRKVTKIVSRIDEKNQADIEASANNFVKMTKAKAQEFPPSAIFNADQSGHNHEIRELRTLSFRGEKSTQLCVKSIKNTTSSHTCMPIISMDGSLLSPMLLCLKETNGLFGPRVQQEVEELGKRFPNVHICCSKSGKMDKLLMNTWVKNCLKPNLKQKSILLLDSWSGQKDAGIYEDISSLCEILTIPPKTTSIVQPLDVTTFRQYKIIRKTLTERVHLEGYDVNLASRSNIVALHAVIHNQLCAPIFREMHAYPWKQAGYLDHAKEFKSVNQVLFEKVGTKCADCAEVPSARCAYADCHKELCIRHFLLTPHLHNLLVPVEPNEETQKKRAFNVAFETSNGSTFDDDDDDFVPIRPKTLKKCA